MASLDHQEHHNLVIPPALAGKRLDLALAELLPHLSRNRLQSWIQKGLVWVNSRTWRAKDKVCGNELVEVRGTLPLKNIDIPQIMDLDIRYQDADLIVINKPAGLVVHPAAGNLDGTLLNGLLNWDPNLACLPRCGIVHRLDKDTSGLLVIARSIAAYTGLVTQLQDHSIHREYAAVVAGTPVTGGTVDLPIGRHPTQRTKMAVVKNTNTGKTAITHFQVQERFVGYSLLKVRLNTGRTHQIRVHMSHINLPIVGDSVYSQQRPRSSPGLNQDLTAYIRSFPRQALHSKSLRLKHPLTEAILAWELPLPEDMEHLVSKLRSQSALCADVGKNS